MQVSLAFTIVAYMIVAVSPLQGFFVDRFGPRKVVLTSIPLFGLSLAALYFTPANLFVYYVLWALVPVLGLGLWPLGYLQAVTQWFDRRLGLALGCANAGIGVGSTIVPLITAALIPVYGWRGALLGLGGARGVRELAARVLLSARAVDHRRGREASRRAQCRRSAVQSSCRASRRSGFSTSRSSCSA